MDDFDKVPLNSFMALHHPRTPSVVVLNDAQLIETVSYEDQSFHLFVLKKAETKLVLSYPELPTAKRIPGVTLSFICTADEPYISIFRETLEEYKVWLPENYEISVVLFGEATLPEWVRVQKEPMEKFHMAYARNQSLKNATYDHIFILDVDVRITSTQISSVIEKFQSLPNHGIFNLKNGARIGNGLYFGNRHTMIQNGYDERFKRFWWEDTEHLMNYSRIGIIPTVVCEDFHRVDHSRSKTLNREFSNTNYSLFTNILNLGTRNCG